MWGGRRGGGGEEGCTPLPAPTTSTRPGCGDHPGMASPLTTESQSQSPLLPDSHSVCCRPAGGPAPSPLQPHFGFAQAAGENSCPLAFGGGGFLALLLLPWDHQATVGPPDPQALLDTPCTVYPVPTRSPCPVSSILLYIHKRTFPVPAPNPAPKGGQNHDQSATRVKLSPCDQVRLEYESSSWGTG